MLQLLWNKMFQRSYEHLAQRSLQGTTDYPITAYWTTRVIRNFDFGPFVSLYQQSWMLQLKALQVQTSTTRCVITTGSNQSIGKQKLSFLMLNWWAFSALHSGCKRSSFALTRHRCVFFDCSAMKPWEKNHFQIKAVIKTKGCSGGTAILASESNAAALM